MQDQGPNDFHNNITDNNIFQCVVINESSPYYIKLGPFMEQVYIMVTIELVLNRSHLIPMQDTS